MKNNPTVRIIRWALVPIVAVLAASAASLIIYLLNKIAISFRGPDLIDFFVPFTSAALNGFIFVYAGAAVAPNNKKKVALVLTILFWVVVILSSAINIYLATKLPLLNADGTRFEPPIWVITVRGLVGLATSAYAYFQFPEED